MVCKGTPAPEYCSIADKTKDTCADTNKYAFYECFINKNGKKATALKEFPPC